MTKYREGLAELAPYTREGAAAVVDIIDDFAAHFLYFKAVSYTHLDVYKRQPKYQSKFRSV